MEMLPRLYLVTHRKRIAGPGLLDALDEALDAGVRLVMLRERDMTARDLLALAKKAVALADARGARLLVNDRLDVALLARAAGAHLREASVPLAEARRLIWPGALLGASVHTPEDAARAAATGASLIVFGPVYATRDKAYRAPQGLAALRLAARAVRAATGSHATHAVRVPLYAIGGVTPERAGECIAAGAHGVAVMSGILGADSIPARTREYLRAIERATRRES
ncbi:MAG: thiamine phosphate synthase [bacterium]